MIEKLLDTLANFPLGTITGISLIVHIVIAIDKHRMERKKERSSKRPLDNQEEEAKG
ncbi:hypothetical protein [Shouchella lehensis]|uniref:hypothetical protein n=1 Tax=Shouchella lehensis TaxID=300825 RepID=UPI0014194BCF|nr:hypothetical protein [Shouchella lehensis]